MVVVSYSGKEINAKLVYYGPGLCGKTTNLEHVYDSIPSTHRGKMVSMKTRTERTLFFDFLPVDLGELGGFKTRFLLYTVPGQIYYNATRKLVLRGVDAVVFVADSARGKMNENLESLENLKENLREYSLDLATMPMVFQYNKRDLPDTYSVEEMNQALNPGSLPFFEAVATNGTGVFDTLKGVSRILLEKLSKEIKFAPRATSSGALAASHAARAESALAQPVSAASPASSNAASPAVKSVSASTPTSSSSTPAASKATPSALPVGVRAAGPSPSAARPSVPPSAAVSAVPPSSAFDSKGNPAVSTPPGEKDGFGRKLARMFGFSKPASDPVLSAPATAPSAKVGTTPPAAAALAPRAAVVTSGRSTRISRIDPASARASSTASKSDSVLEKRIQVPVSLELTSEELASGARLRLVLDIDLTTMRATVEREEKTGTR